MAGVVLWQQWRLGAEALKKGEDGGLGLVSFSSFSFLLSYFFIIISIYKPMSGDIVCNFTDYEISWYLLSLKHYLQLY